MKLDGVTSGNLKREVSPAVNSGVIAEEMTSVANMITILDYKEASAIYQPD
jgi:hypothetical protein